MIGYEGTSGYIGNQTRTTMKTITPSLQAFVESEILPLYEGFDKAHRVDHVQTVIANSMAIAEHYPEVNVDIVYATAAYHDLGLRDGRERHHLVSGEIVQQDTRLRQWLTEEEILLIKEAVEDHRASSSHAPRSIYGRIVAEADRIIEPDTTMRRAVQYGLNHHPELDKEEQYERFHQHMLEKYAEGGYLKLWIPESPNAARLAELRCIIADKHLLREAFERIYKEEVINENE
jgi:uncharacterized protein